MNFFESLFSCVKHKTKKNRRGTKRLRKVRKSKRRGYRGG